MEADELKQTNYEALTNISVMETEMLMTSRTQGFLCRARSKTPSGMRGDTLTVPDTLSDPEARTTHRPSMGHEAKGLAASPSVPSVRLEIAVDGAWRGSSSFSNGMVVVNDNAR